MNRNTGLPLAAAIAAALLLIVTAWRTGAMSGDARPTVEVPPGPQARTEDEPPGR